MRSMVSSSTGGKLSLNTPAGPVRRNNATSTASRTRGPSPFSHCGTRLGDLDETVGSAFRISVGAERSGTGWLDQEDSAPAQLGELALVGVKHEWPGVLVGELEDRTLALT